MLNRTSLVVMKWHGPSPELVVGVGTAVEVYRRAIHNPTAPVEWLAKMVAAGDVEYEEFDLGPNDTPVSVRHLL